MLFIFVFCVIVTASLYVYNLLFIDIWYFVWHNFIENISIMLGGIYFIEQYIMNVFTSFYSGLEEGMENKKKVVIHDATNLHPRGSEKNASSG